MKLKFCVACGSAEDLQHHHLVPRAEGGGNETTNLITLCAGCHFKVHDRQMNGTYNFSKRTKAGLAVAKAKGRSSAASARFWGSGTRPRRKPVTRQ